MLQNVIKIWKTRKNRKDNQATLQKPCIFRKVLYWSPGKLLEIVDFRQKSSISDGKNPKDTWRTRQNRVKTWIRSTKIVENLPKVEKSSIRRCENIRPTEGGWMSSNGKKIYFLNLSEQGTLVWMYPRPVSCAWVSVAKADRFDPRTRIKHLSRGTPGPYTARPRQPTVLIHVRGLKPT